MSTRSTYSKAMRSSFIEDVQEMNLRYLLNPVRVEKTPEQRQRDAWICQKRIEYSLKQYGL